MSEKFIDEVIGTHKGYQYIVKLSPRGHRCGYIKINDHKLWSEIEKSYRDWNYKLDLDIKVHGGVTFVESYSKSDYLPIGDWIGFDCIHLGDFPDINAMILNFPFDKQKMLTVTECHYSEFENLKIWYKEDVENECKKVICQLHDYIEQKSK